MERDDDAIANAVSDLFPPQAQRLRAGSRNSRASRLADRPGRAYEAERRVRTVRPELPQTKPTVCT